MNGELVNEMIEFGMTEYEARVYLKLVTRGPLTTSDISKLTKIPQSKIYEIIKNLSLKTIIEVSVEKGHKKFKAVAPEHAIRKMIERREVDLNVMKTKGDEILKNISKKSVPFENKKCIWLSEGKKEFLEKFSLMIKKAEKYAYGITKDFSRVSSLDEEIAAAAKRGVKVKFLGIGDLKDLSEERAKWYSSKNVEIRIINLEIYPRAFIVDNKEVCLRIDNEENSEFVSTSNPALINFVKSYFDVLWQNAKKYK